MQNNASIKRNLGKGQKKKALARQAAYKATLQMESVKAA